MLRMAGWISKVNIEHNNNIFMLKTEIKKHWVRANSDWLL